MEIKKIKKLIKLLKTEDIAEIELEDEDGFIRISRYAAAAIAPMAAGIAQQASAQNATSEPQESEQSSAPEKAYHIIKSPMVGTFYAAPAPDAEPYVKVGDIVRKGQTLCIIEAMKVMNEIKSDADGRVVKIYVENAAPVEFGQELFAIDTED